MNERLPTTTFVVPAEDYERLRGIYDNATLERAYVGRWPDRAAFGRYLFEDTRAEQHLVEIPGWLRPYVVLDGERYVRDLESERAYAVLDVDSGIAVFDGMLLPGI